MSWISDAQPEFLICVRLFSLSNDPSCLLDKCTDWYQVLIEMFQFYC